METRRRMTPGFSTFNRLTSLRFLVAGRGHDRRRSCPPKTGGLCREIIALSTFLRGGTVRSVFTRQDLEFQRSSRSEPSDQPAPDQFAELDHQTEASTDSRLFTSLIGFATGTGHESIAPFPCRLNRFFAFVVVPRLKGLCV